MCSSDDIELVCDDCNPLFLVVWSLTAYHDNRHGQTMTACDAWRLTVRASDVWRGCTPVALHAGLFYALCMINQAFSCSICFQRPGFASLQSRSTVIVQLSHPRRAILTRQVTLQRLIFVGKLMALFFHSIASLVMAECLQRLCRQWSSLPLLMFWLWFVWILIIWTGKWTSFSINPYIGKWTWLNAVYEKYINIYSAIVVVSLEFLTSPFTLYGLVNMLPAALDEQMWEKNGWGPIQNN